MVYTALIADVKSSRDLTSEKREEVQILIKSSIDYLNKIFKKVLKFDVVFGAGDEFQGLFISPVHAYSYLRLLRMIISPYEIRCGIGVGSWDVRILDGISTEQDGSAYHFARKALNKAGEKNSYNILLNSNDKSDMYVNSLINISYDLTSKQSKHQSALFLLTELMFPLFDGAYMDIEVFKKLHKLVQKKEDVSQVDIIDNFKDKIEPFYLYTEENFNSEMVVSSMWKKGISTKISNITNTSRQNIDKIIKTGYFIESRNIDATILLFLEDTFGR